MRSRSSAILMNFGLGAAPPEAYIQIAPGKKIAPSWEKIMAPGKTLHLAPWEKNLRQGSVGSRNWALYGRICI